MLFKVRKEQVLTGRGHAGGSWPGGNVLPLELRAGYTSDLYYPSENVKIYAECDAIFI